MWPSLYAGGGGIRLCHRALVALGCCMMRVCNLDTCPAGIATQNPQLRSRFSGKPEYVVNFMEFVAQELREYMAALGIRTVDELVGRSDLLRVREKLVTHRAETWTSAACWKIPGAAGRPTSIPEMFTTSIWNGPWMRACCWPNWARR